MSNIKNFKTSIREKYTGESDAIFYVDGKYIYECVTYEEMLKKVDECVYTSNPYPNYLYNGRVKLDYIKFFNSHVLQIVIDGTQIQHDVIKKDFIRSFSPVLSFPVATEYLNRIEAVGVDQFMSDYKVKIEEWQSQELNNSNIYVASSWKNEFYPEVVDSLRKAGFNVYDFRNPPSGSGGFKWENVDPKYMNWTPQQYKTNLNSSKADQQFKEDIEAMKSCGICVLVLPCGRSAHTEAGWFAGKGRKVIAYIPTKQEPELMYKLFDGIACSTEELIDLLKNK